MKNVKTRGATHNFSKPENWDESAMGTCGDLSVRAELGQGDVVQLASTWAPSATELAHLNRGGVIEMLLCTVSQPPAALSVVDPVEARFVIDDKPAITINEDAHGDDHHNPDHPLNVSVEESFARGVDPLTRTGVGGYDEHGPATP